MSKPGMGRGLAAILPETAVAEPELRELPVVAHAPASRGSVAYRELALELAEREEADRVSVERLANTQAEVEVKAHD